MLKNPTLTIYILGEDLTSPGIPVQCLPHNVHWQGFMCWVRSRCYWSQHEVIVVKTLPAESCGYLYQCKIWEANQARSQQKELQMKIYVLTEWLKLALVCEVCCWNVACNTTGCSFKQRSFAIVNILRFKDSILFMAAYVACKLNSWTLALFSKNADWRFPHLGCLLPPSDLEPVWLQVSLWP